MSSSEQIGESIEARIAELRNEMTSLEAGRAALKADGASRSRSKRPGAAGAERPKRRRSATAASGTSETTMHADATPPAASEPSATTVARPSRSRAAAGRKQGARREPAVVLLAAKLEAMLRDARTA